MQDALEYLSMDLMERGTFHSYEKVFDKLPPHKQDLQVFRYVLGMFRNAEKSQNPFLRDVCLIGGYAVVPYVAEQLGDEHIYEWRGSHDIDILLNGPTYEQDLFADFTITENQKSLAHPFKKQIKLKNEDGHKDIEVDTYFSTKGRNAPFQIAKYQFNEQFWKSTNSLPVFGIPIIVPNQIELIKMKADVRVESTGLPRQKDIYDILTLLGSVERQEYAPYEVINRLSLAQIQTMKECLQYRDNATFPEPLHTIPLKPSKKYTADLEKEIEQKLEELIQ
jgi:hypothetical protein